MMRDMKLLGYMVFHLCVVLFAFTLLAGAFDFKAFAQPREQVEDLTRRVATMESLNLDHRLTIMETMLSGVASDLRDLKKSAEERGADWTRIGTVAGTALLILERAFRAIAGKVKEEDNA